MKHLDFLLTSSKPGSDMHHLHVLSGPVDCFGLPDTDKLEAQGKIEEHPNACEITLLYAACRDGRRWRGRRWLTGPQAGQSEDVTVLVGAPAAGEDGGITAGRLVRALVGIRP